MPSASSGGAAGFVALAARAEGRDRHRPEPGAAGVSRGDSPRLVEIATADICHQTNPRPVTARDFERIFARGDVSAKRERPASAVNGIGISRLLLPRRPEAADLHRQDAAVRRAVGGALGRCRAGALAVMIPSPAGDTPKGDVGLERLRRLARRPGARGRLRRVRPRATARRRSTSAGRATGSATTTRRAARRLRGARQAGARHLPRPAGDQRGASAARCSRTSTPSGPDRCGIASGDLRPQPATRSSSSPARGSRSCIAGTPRATVNSVHHQAHQGPGRRASWSRRAVRATA